MKIVLDDLNIFLVSRYTHIMPIYT